MGYYNTSGASFGLQAGAQKCGYAMFLVRSVWVRVSEIGGACGPELRHPRKLLSLRLPPAVIANWLEARCVRQGDMVDRDRNRLDAVSC